jgi:hypothetical protein
MGWFILAIILWIIAIGLAFVAKLTNDNDVRLVSCVAIAVCLILGFGLFVFGGVKSVPVKNIGVPQAFGTVAGNVYTAGMHETWQPWLHLTDVDETVQTTPFTGASCLTIRIGGQQSACANIKIKWQVRPSAADALFEDYANQGDLMSTIENSVVVLELEQVTNQVLGDYNPITDVSSVTNTNGTQSLFTTFGPTILRDMRADIGSQINILALTLPSLQYSATVESKLQSIQQAYADFAIAQENVKVNEENSLAFQKLGTPNLNQLVAQCLTDLKADAGSLPAGFQCIPGSSTTLALSKLG